MFPSPRRVVSLLAFATVAALVVSPSASASSDCGTHDGRGCSPERARVDVAAPTFSNPTRITNPLFPISDLSSALLLGHVDGKPFRTETTLLPETEIGPVARPGDRGARLAVHGVSRR